MARLPKGTPTLRDVLREQRRLLRSQGTSSPFTNSGLSVTAPGVVDASKATVLFAPSSIGNDALASPYGDADKAALSKAAQDATDAKAAAATAQTAAGTAQTTANGRNRTFRLPAGTPPAGPFAAGDLWFVTDQGNRLQQWDGSGWVAFGLGSQAVSNLDAGAITTGTLSGVSITGVTVTGSTVQTATGFPRLSMNSTGNLVSYRPDGTTNFEILKADSNTSDGAVLGLNAALRFVGNPDGAYIKKDSTQQAFVLRATGGTSTGAGATLYEQAATGLDSNGDAYSNAAHIISGGSVALKLLSDQSAAFSGYMRAASMRMVQASGGVATTRADTTWGILSSGPVPFFIAPPSGIVRVDLSSSMSGSTAASNARADVQCRQGTLEGQGSDLYTPTGIIVLNGTAAQRASGFRLITGLTPGTSYYLRVVLSSGDTSLITVSFSTIIITPSL